ncbi:MAG: CBS domain-containing protein [Saprospiraceae bacterium]|nr:CBS domain-containing protein [Saprospiraceae bacterium]
MQNFSLIVSAIICFIVLLILIIYLKSKFGNKFEIKNPDIILALLPIVIWLLLSGEISSLQVGDLKFETAFKKAKNESISNQIDKLPITVVRAESKASIFQIETILQSRPQALKFIVGNRNYYQEAISEYLMKLSRSTIKYVVFDNRDNRFLGLIPLVELNELISDQNQLTIDSLTSWLTTGNENKILSIKGILPSSISISENTTKQEALERMEKANSDLLPVIDKDSKLRGVVERSRLVASLLLDVSKSIDKL